MNVCARPLDPIDVEALAAGAEPLHAPDGAAHARACAACAAAVAEAKALARSLETADLDLRAPDLADRVLRLRPFSSAERRRLRLWGAPFGLAGVLFLAGFVLLALPGITAREQASLAVAALAPVAALSRALVRAVVELVASAPAGVGALADALRRESSVGLAALLLLLPAGLGLSRALARARR